MSICLCEEADFSRSLKYGIAVAGDEAEGGCRRSEREEQRP